MKISVRWLNEYLDPANVTAEGAEQVLTQAGFPIETSVQLPNGDVMLDVEVTSNRGDCLSHIGLAREIAAATGRRLRMPKVPIPPTNGRNGDGGNGSLAATAGGGPDSVSSVCQLDNRVPDMCRLFTARVIRGVKVKRSPAWMIEALEAVGQRPINNIVDVTNYVGFEFGQPTHVFDLARLRPGPEGVPRVIVRYAAKGEKLMLLDGKTIDLTGDELVVADSKGPVSLAGIMGGGPTQVTEQTVDVLLEAATWDPVTIRTTARRLGTHTEASFRFERTVDPRTIDSASRRAAALIVQLGGGSLDAKPGAIGARLLQGVLQDGAEPEPLTRVSMRTARVRAILGADFQTGEMIKALRGHEVQVSEGPGDATTPSDEGQPRLDCTIPPFRPDLTREIDLIEEVARTLGLARIPIHDKIEVRVAPAQKSEKARAELASVLTGLGFFETVTFSFVSPASSQPFLAPGTTPLLLCDERRNADPVLRPSVLPSLLACRKANQDAGSHAPGGVRLYEIASVFVEPDRARSGSVSGERRVLAIIADAAAPDGSSSLKTIDLKQTALRLIRGVLDSLAKALGGRQARIEFIPVAQGKSPPPGFESDAAAEVGLNGTRIGAAGMLDPAIERAYDLHAHIAAAEVDVDALLALYPPTAKVEALPEFPGIERDLSFVVDEQIRWSEIDSLIGSSALARLDGWEFLTTFRGPQVGPGKKSVTVRLRFRDPARTLRHEEVDPQVGALVKLATDRIGATLRT